MASRLSDWLERRLGHRAILHAALEEPVRGGARWSYVFGSALVVLFLVQAVSGIALAAYYSPSTTDAWASVNYVQSQVFLGWLLRGMHHFGAAAMVVLLGAHLLQTVWYGAYRAPRELNWLAGILLLVLTLGFALTGYLLPWDQKGYWATQVATSIAGTVPLIGDGLQRFLQGGANYGNLTLTRFYALHTLVLPVLLTGAVVLHVYLFRRHGVTIHPARDEAEADRTVEPFFPRQLFRDTLFAGAVVAVVLGLAWRNHGAPLEAPADPSSQFLARPEWYFLPLFQLLKYFEGPLEIVGTVVLPSVAMGFLVALPFIHAALQQRSKRAVGVLTGVVGVGLAGIVGMGVLATVDDRGNPAVARMEATAHAEALQARRLALQGVPVSGPLDLYLNDPALRGARLYKEACETCHHDCRRDPYKGDPCLEGYASRDWLAKLIRDPQSPYFFGNSRIDEMDPYSGDEAALSAIVEFLYSQGERPDVNAALAEKGAQAFEGEGCGGCHGLDGSGTGDAPDLRGYASAEWLTAFVRHPDAGRFYGKANKMKRFPVSELKEDELSAIVAYLRTRSAEPVKFLSSVPSHPPLEAPGGVP